MTNKTWLLGWMGVCWGLVGLVGMLIEGVPGRALCWAGQQSDPEALHKPGDAGFQPSRLATQGPKPPPALRPDPAEMEQALQRGVAFLVRSQNPDGSWGSPRRTKDLNIYAPPPGAHHAFQTGTTALALSALLEVTAARPGLQTPEVRRTIQRGEEWIFVHIPTLRRATPDALYNVWGHAYALQALARMYHRNPNDQARRQEILRLIRQQTELLGRYETVDGGWGYYDFQLGSQKPAGPTFSFVSATVLVALHEVQQLGVEIPRPMIDRALASIRRQRKPDFSYLYGEYLRWEPMHPVNRPAGSLGRSQVCNLALRLWGDPEVTDQVLTTWLDRLFARHGWLDLGRKRPIPHESFFAIAAYFFYYGHYYAARCIELLPPEKQPPYQDHLAAVLLRLQEKDGSWWDYPFYDYHQPYGTAFALMSLLRCYRTGP
ncbi:MAG: terpene cyclase/mutase family protein [Thermoguttaceae bacterium]|nr:terpene cyclase/mutase family protein [Thermoguttaceae bacterium]MDW8038497.1 terpene cyclase/mutase family protein [Thermoguttaceae bacterium]